MNRRILLLTPHLKGPGGVTNYYNALDLKHYLPVDYFYVNKPQSQNAVGTILRLLTNYLKFIVLMFGRTYGLIHLNPSLDKKSYFRDALFIAISRIFKKKCIVFFRGWEDDFEEGIKASSLKLSIFKNTYAKADIFIVLGKLFKEKLVGLGVATDKKFYVESTVADDSYMENFDLEAKLEQFHSKKVCFLFISRILKEKGIYIALEAYEKIQERFPAITFEFIIAGDGPDLQEVKEYVSERDLQGIQFTGYIREEAKANVLTQAHILLFPTNYGEGLPNCILEGMLYGMPVITREVAAITDIIKPGVNGYITKSLRTADFVDGISQLVENETLYLQVSRTNYRQANEKFTRKKVRNRITKIYESVLL